MCMTENEQGYCFPSLDLLKKGNGTTLDRTDEITKMTEQLQKALTDFGINVKIKDVSCGAQIARFSLDVPNYDTFRKLANRAEDFAMALNVSSVRFALGDRADVYAEVPLESRKMVCLRDALDSVAFRKSKAPLSFPVGQNLMGETVVANLAAMPHLLIGGMTGSGKSSLIDSMLVSFLMNRSPEDLKLILIDPKGVELGLYASVPHLLIPVVTDPYEGIAAIKWAIDEMYRRYSAFDALKVRDLSSYNAASLADGGKKMPQLVIVVEELAELMLASSRETEDSICRLAQMGRAAGIFVVVSTQRARSEVICGLMKANIPSRIAFAVPTSMESRIVLDNSGAEKLVGNGDMLFSPIGGPKQQRLQGYFISQSEVKNVTDFLSEKNATQFDEGVQAIVKEKCSALKQK